MSIKNSDDLRKHISQLPYQDKLELAVHVCSMIIEPDEYKHADLLKFLKQVYRVEFKAREFMGLQQAMVKARAATLQLIFPS